MPSMILLIFTIYPDRIEITEVFSKLKDFDCELITLLLVIMNSNKQLNLYGSKRPKLVFFIFSTLFVFCIMNDV